MRTAFLGLMASAFVVWGCTPQRVSAPAGASAPAAGPPTAGAPAAGTAPTTGAAAAGTASTADSCSSGKPLTVHFLNVGQGLSVLVDLPNDKHILVDAGPSSSVVDSLKTTLSTTNLDWLWITHQHTDHYGGARAVLKAYTVDTFIDNGESSDKTTEEALHKLVAEKNATYVVVSPTKRQLPNLDTGLVKISLAAPSSWPVSNCDGDNANNCSIGLRLDFCKSSVLLVGDAEQAEEAQLIGTVGPATLLQVGHHGSATSTSDAFLAAVKPQYAVVSAGKPNEGMNTGYCHPREVTVDRLFRNLGNVQAGTIDAFDETGKCSKMTPAPTHWHQVPTSDRMWFTERDGDVVLSTKGDGTFQRVK